MGNRQRIAIAAAAILCGIGLIGILSVNAAKNGSVRLSIGGKVELRNTIELPLSETDSLEVIYTSKNLEIYPGEGDSIVIKEYLFSSGREALVEVAGEERKTVVRGGRGQTIALLGFFTGIERIEIYVPKEGIETLRLETRSGNITAKSGFSLEAEKLQLRAASGNIKWMDTKASEYEIQTNSGNIGLDGMEGGGRVQASSGNVRLQAVKGILDANTNSGNIAVERLYGSGSMEAGSGNVKVEACEVTGDLRVAARSGNVHLTLPGNLSFETRIQTGSGGIRTFFKESLSFNEKGNQAEGTVGEAPFCVIEAETTSGNIQISAD